ncbi:MAG: helix-turn-helix domain-containing protein [Candidatus Micrarchaeota archaeon]
MKKNLDERVFALLKQEGALHFAEIARRLDLYENTASRACYRLTRDGRVQLKRVGTALVAEVS